MARPGRRPFLSQTLPKRQPRQRYSRAETVSGATQFRPRRGRSSPQVKSPSRVAGVMTECVRNQQCATTSIPVSRTRLSCGYSVWARAAPDMLPIVSDRMHLGPDLVEVHAQHVRTSRTRPIWQPMPGDPAVGDHPAHRPLRGTQPAGGWFRYPPSPRLTELQYSTTAAAATVTR